MITRNQRNLFAATVGAFAGILFSMNAVAALLPSKVEQKCVSKLGKLSTKLAMTAAKELSRCRNDDLSGAAVGACPNAGNTTKIAKIASKLVGAANASCGSVCSVSQDVECVADALCPPLSNGFNEKCSAGAANLPFDISRIGFPGPYCENAIGRPIRASADIGECSQALSEQAAGDLIDSIYGSLTNASGVSAGAQDCLAAVSKAAQKVTKITATSVAKCRDSINKGKTLGDPKTCATSDAKAASKIANAAEKLRAVVASNCATVLSEIDICGAGIGGVVAVEDAQTCLADAAQQVADSQEVPVSRLYAPVSIIDSAYPSPAICGDGVADQLPNRYLLLGEECDGTDDAECPGECLPPGDLFECTCGDRPRMRAFADGPATDSDAGWTGNSHDQNVADKSGYIVDLSNCDCSLFEGATCAGSTTDPICDLDGIQTPFCQWDATQSVRCDTVGNNNGKDEDKDCQVCDEFSVNAGATCADSTDCQAQCYDSAGVPTGPCSDQSSCAGGDVCRGQCDGSQRCIITPNGAPLPVGAAGAAVCNVQLFREEVTGTRNMETGENETYFKLFSITHLGESNGRPCPVCGGFCVSDTGVVGAVCEGRCETSTDQPCRFDSDCPGAEKCSEASPDCPDGRCELGLVCGTDPDGNAQTYGNPCRIDYESSNFGTISGDCLPAPGLNIGGEGFRVNHEPTGSELKTLDFAIPCTASGFELYDCPCPSDGGAPTKPNACNPACDAGAELGVGCADGNGSSGQGTKCDAGSNAGKLCDEDADCPGGSCNDNPRHCIDDPSFERVPCTSDAQCGTGTCVDACPTGRCVPLCLPEAGDPEDGFCAAGPDIYACSGGRYSYVTCTRAAAESGCAATCSVTPIACGSSDDCPSGETCQGSCENSRDCEAGADGNLGTADDLVGAGVCIANPRGCNLDPISIEGGDTLNGKGDNTNYLRSSIWCFGKTNNNGVNATSGFGGPGAMRERGTNVLNVESIP
jgi:hypothetical protein